MGFGERVTIEAEAEIGDEHAFGNGAGWLVACGRPLEEMHVAIVDEDGNELPDGHLGEVKVIGPNVADGYTVDTRQLDQLPGRRAAHRRRRADARRRALRARPDRRQHEDPRPHRLRRGRRGPGQRRRGHRQPQGRRARRRRRLAQHAGRDRRGQARRLGRGGRTHPRGRGRRRRPGQGARQPAAHDPAHLQRQAAPAADVEGPAQRLDAGRGRLHQRQLPSATTPGALARDRRPGRGALPRPRPRPDRPLRLAARRRGRGGAQVPARGDRGAGPRGPVPRALGRRRPRRRRQVRADLRGARPPRHGRRRASA